MPKRFTIGQVKSCSRAKVIWRAHELEHVQIGDVIAPLNDYELEWDEDCVKPNDLEPWRHEGDPLADAVVRALRSRAGQDCLERIIGHLELPADEQDGCVKQFWDEVVRLPPQGVSAIPSSLEKMSPISFSDQLTADHALSRPNHHPEATLAEGQAVFWRYSAQIFGALLHFSLAGGFSAQRVMGVLNETGYLVSKGKRATDRGMEGLCPVTENAGKVREHKEHHGFERSEDFEKAKAEEKRDKDRTYRRLLETTQAVMDYMNDMTPQTGSGWQTAIRVRLLHAAVRVRISEKRGMLNTYDEALDGVPINQEDLIATLGSFAVAPLWSLRRMGFTLTKAEEAAYVAAWRHIGYYLGISPERLQRYYSRPASAEKLYASNTMHLFSIDYVTSTSPCPTSSASASRSSSSGKEHLQPPMKSSLPFDPRSTPTYRLLLSTTGRPPFYRKIEESLCLSRLLLGDGLADRLALPRQSLMRRSWTRAGFLAQRYIHFFGQHYPRRKWEADKVQVTRRLIGMVVWWQLGKRRAGFEIWEHGMQMDNQSESEGAGTQASEVENLENGPKAAKKAIKLWRGLMIELGIISLSVGFLVLWGGWVLASVLTRTNIMSGDIYCLLPHWKG